LISLRKCCFATVSLVILKSSMLKEWRNTDWNYFKYDFKDVYMIMNVIMNMNIIMKNESLL
jgi:hypothetical protein